MSAPKKLPSLPAIKSATVALSTVKFRAGSHRLLPSEPHDVQPIPLKAPDKSRRYCLEMICADFLAEANLQTSGSHPLLTN
jgi:hypothetical protein